MSWRCISWLAILGIAVLFAGCQSEHSTMPEGGPTTDSVPGAPAMMRLASDPREAIKLECFYALNPGHGGGSNRPIGGNAVSDWPYLSSDMNAYWALRNHYGSTNSSVQSLFYSSPAAYALQNFAGVGSVGRGGQCRYFANLILYRSATYFDNSRFLRTYQDYINDYSGLRRWTKPISQVRVGDVIQTQWANGHTAVVVKIVAGTEGVNVTSVDVVDANYVGGAGNEIIGRHVIANTGSGVGDLDSYIALKLAYQ
jgi:hypothetical protein